jgi:nitrate reductase gamma subunit
MLESLFDLPLLIAGPIIVGSLCLYGVIGLSIVRRYILPRLRSQDSYSDFTGAMLQAVMVFYGLAVALIAVSVWQSYSDAAKISSQEATAAAALYRDLSGYAEPPVANSRSNSVITSIKSSNRLGRCSNAAKSRPLVWR